MDPLSPFVFLVFFVVVCVCRERRGSTTLLGERQQIFSPRPCTQGRGVGGEGFCLGNPNPLTPLPRSGGEGRRFPVALLPRQGKSPLEPDAPARSLAGASGSGVSASEVPRWRVGLRGERQRGPSLARRAQG